MNVKIENGRWSKEKANAWFEGQEWPCGFNYVPANAISYTEMWMDDDFNSALIDEELALAQETGFNCLRAVLSFVVWEAEAEAFKRRLDAFLSICEKRGFRVMPSLFDDCIFGPLEDPVFGKQPELVEGWYANAWTPSPGHGRIRNKACWPKLLAYAKDLISTFKDDPRIWIWDIYNEPCNNGMDDATMPFLKELVPCARDCEASQPMTIGEWNSNETLNGLIRAASDISSFHDYSGPETLERRILEMKSFGRPAICTEWLNRNSGSSVAACLPILRRHGIGAMHWGLVNGRTQTHLNWGHRPGDPPPKLWQHDIYKNDRTPCDPAEIELFKAAMRWKKPGCGR